MLAVWPDSVIRSVSGRGGYKVLVRPSMQKFPSERNTLEVNLKITETTGNGDGLPLRVEEQNHATRE